MFSQGFGPLEELGEMSLSDIVGNTRFGIPAPDRFKVGDCRFRKADVTASMTSLRDWQLESGLCLVQRNLPPGVEIGKTAHHPTPAAGEEYLAVLPRYA